MLAEWRQEIAIQQKPVAIVAQKERIPAEWFDRFLTPQNLAPSVDMWRRNMEQTPEFGVQEILVRSMDVIKDPLFIDVQVTMHIEDSPQETQVDMYMRGRSVSVLLVLTYMGEDFTVVTVQPKVPTAKASFPEIPSAAVPKGSELDTLKTIKRRTGLEIRQSDLINMTEHAFGNEYPGIIPCPSYSDEQITLWLCQLKVDSHHELERLRQAVMTDDNDNNVALRVVPLADLWQIAPDGKSLSALIIYHHLKKNGTLLQFPQRSLSQAFQTEEPVAK
eukprot:c18307_g1_i3.p1 GENE.c18307_g1_i3~~c18307_g1_i3.p1  ORF type:complete len:276 (+),score=49.86 c18307_g1_i3:179-1006(+)